jgi:hypothetical protein
MRFTVLMIKFYNPKFVYFLWKHRPDLNKINFLMHDLCDFILEKMLYRTAQQETLRRVLCSAETA